MGKPASVATHLARNRVSLRHTRAITQEALAKSAGMPRSTIANLEWGTGNPSLAVLVKMTNALEIPIDELLASPRAKVRHWSAADIGSRRQGRGVIIRPLVPEPVPQEMLTVMDARHPSPARHAGVLYLPRRQGNHFRRRGIVMISAPVTC